MSNQLLRFNGINAITGTYVTAPRTIQEFARAIRGDRPAETKPDAERLLTELEDRKNRDASAKKGNDQQHLGVREGVDIRKLEEAGWGILFAYNIDPAVREALQPLMQHRQEQASRRKEHYYRELSFFPGDTKWQFLSNYGAAPGVVDPENLPYYLLIVGDPRTIPYSFQYQMDVQYGVGRIFFRTADEYAQYAQSVIAAETGKIVLPRTAAFFGVENQDDPATWLSANYLAAPLAETMAQEHPDWKVTAVLRGDATKAHLKRLMGGEETPALLFTASHGISFPAGHPLQVAHQGALLCQEWVNSPDEQGPILPGKYFAGDDLGDDARVLGLVAFCFACFGAGTPQRDDYATLDEQQQEIAPHDFLARLPQRLLAHPKGGALAVVGHVERTWSYSFHQEDTGPQLATFQSTLKRLMMGYPVGAAMEYFNGRYAELASDLNTRLQQIHSAGQRFDDGNLVNLWTASNDARSYVVIGDPAVRLPVGSSPSEERELPVRETLTQPTPSLTPPANEPSHGPFGSSSPLEHVRENVKQAAKKLAQTFQQAADEAPAATEGEMGTRLTEEPDETATEASRPAGGPVHGTVHGPFGHPPPLEHVREHVRETLQQAAMKLAHSLQEVVDKTVALEVTTYTSEEMENVSYDPAQSQLRGSARLRALTRINLDGNTLVCLPEKDGEVDTALWAIHRELVQQAHANRNEILKLILSMPTDLLKKLQGL